MSNIEKKSAQIIAIDARKVRSGGSADETHKSGRYGYRMAGCGFLVGAQVPSEVVIAPAIFPVPKAPEWVLGLANISGFIVPVFDLWKFVCTRRPERNGCTVLVLNLGVAAVGLVIDNLPKPVPLDSQPIRTLPAAPALQPFLSGGVHAFGCEWWEFDHQKFLVHLSAVDAR